MSTSGGRRVVQNACTETLATIRSRRSSAPADFGRDLIPLAEGVEGRAGNPGP
jgi:hypothetical protein